MKGFRLKLKTRTIKDFSLLMTGTLVGQVLTLAAMPILTRVYSPSEFGEFAVVVSSIAVLGSFSTGNYNMAIIIPTSEGKATQLFGLSICITIVISMLALIAMVSIPRGMYETYDMRYVEKYLAIIPAGILLSGFLNTFISWNSRAKNYKRISVSKVAQSASTTTVNIAMGMISPTTWGLLMGYISGMIAQMVALCKNSRLILQSIRRREMMKVAYEYRSFPLFLSPMSLLNALSTNILTYFMAFHHDQSAVGLYSQAVKATSYPLLFISSSFSIIFLQKLNESQLKTALYRKSYLYSMLAGSIMLLPIMLGGSFLFSVIFGEEWRAAGTIATIVSPMLLLSFATSNVSDVFAVINKNHILLLWQALHLSLSLLIIWYFKDEAMRTMLVWYSASGSTMYIVLAAIGYGGLKKHETRIGAMRL